MPSKWDDWRGKRVQDANPTIIPNPAKSFAPQNLYMCQHCFGAGKIYENIGVKSIIYIPTICESCDGRGTTL